jgi:hypothetical protein
VWKSKFYGAFVLNHRVDLHAIDATPARWRGDAGSPPLDRARSVRPTHGLISTQVVADVRAQDKVAGRQGVRVPIQFFDRYLSPTQRLDPAVAGRVPP